MSFFRLIYCRLEICPVFNSFALVTRSFPGVGSLALCLSRGDPSFKVPGTRLLSDSFWVRLADLAAISSQASKHFMAALARLQCHHLRPHQPWWEFKIYIFSVNNNNNWNYKIYGTNFLLLFCIDCISSIRYTYA